MTVEMETMVVREKGEATGLLTGVNHLQLIVRNMGEAVVFYRDVLGLRVSRTGGRYTPPPDIPGGRTVERNYYFELGNREIVTLIEIEDSAPPNDSVFVPSFWPGDVVPPAQPSKMDHLAFNIDTVEQLEWFHDHLQKHGVSVSKIYPATPDTGLKQMTSIYFRDPSGNPLEIATFDLGGGKHHRDSEERWYDPNPVPELFEG